MSIVDGNKTTRAPRPIINIADAPRFERGDGGRFAASLSRLGPLIGAERLGCTVIRVAPGKIAFPCHVHHQTEELFFILEGHGEYRFGAERYEICSGDVLAAPPGEVERAHQIINDGAVDLVYLAVSTIVETDIVEYPDSGKILVLSRFNGSLPGKGGIRHITRCEGSLDYYDGES